MDEVTPDERGNLPRLLPAAYRGKVFVHWNFTVNQRRRGWLTPLFHEAFRWTVLHGCARHQVSCPVYCLMPDHLHLLIAGWTDDADQQLFVRFIRRHLQPILMRAGVEWQKQPYDHVLKQEERDRYGVESVAHYIADNPVKSGLVNEKERWPFTGCVLPGYPEISFFEEDYWVRYWRIVAARSKRPF